MKSGICGIQLDDGFKRDRIIFEKEIQEQDSLFELSLHNKYHEIMEKIEKEPSNSEKAYYYSLINKLNGLSDIMNDLKKQYESVDYGKFTNRNYYELAIFEFNNTCVRSLSYIKNDKAIYERLNLLLDSAAARYSKAYKTIKDITNKNADIQEMNDLLLTHEEYYMKKSSMIKMGGTIYGGLLRIRQIAYDYYFFYKKNHLMLDCLKGQHFIQYGGNKKRENTTWGVHSRCFSARVSISCISFPLKCTPLIYEVVPQQILPAIFFQPFHRIAQPFLRGGYISGAWYPFPLRPALRVRVMQTRPYPL